MSGAVPIPCGCDRRSEDHAAHRCEHAATVVVGRGGRRLAVCPDCVLSVDQTIRRLS